MFLASLIGLLKLYSVFGAALPDKDGELIVAHVIFRHGERTTYSTYPTDPYINETYYPMGLGGLTNNGKKGEFELGQFLKEQYGNFLGDVYTNDLIYVRSTDTLRTKMSAQLVLAGLFPPSKLQMWNKELLWQPIPIEYKESKFEDLMHPSACAYRKKIMKELPLLEDVQQLYIRPYQKLFDFVSNNTGSEIKTLYDLLQIFFVLKTQYDLNMTLPEWAYEVYPEPISSTSSAIYEYENYDNALKLINAGYLLAKIYKDSISKISNKLSPQSRKLFMYSGHESTIGYMMDALGIQENEVPPYGSALMFEIYRIEDQYFIKLRYRYSTNAKEARELSVLGCDVLCPVEKFYKLTEDLLPIVDIKEACKIPVTIPAEEKKQVGEHD